MALIGFLLAGLAYAILMQDDGESVREERGPDFVPTISRPVTDAMGEDDAAYQEDEYAEDESAGEKQKTVWAKRTRSVSIRRAPRQLEMDKQREADEGERAERLTPDNEGGEEVFTE